MLNMTMRFNALLKFENGAVGFLFTNWVAGKRIYSVEMHAKGIQLLVNQMIRQ